VDANILLEIAVSIVPPICFSFHCDPYLDCPRNRLFRELRAYFRANRPGFLKSACSGAVLAALLLLLLLLFLLILAG
jgi:hypothetical protein